MFPYNQLWQKKMYNGIFEVTFNEPYADHKKYFKFETYKSDRDNPYNPFSG